MECGEKRKMKDLIYWPLFLELFILLIFRQGPLICGSETAVLLWLAYSGLILEQAAYVSLGPLSSGHPLPHVG